MIQWKTWKHKNDEYCKWHNKNFLTFSPLWEILQKEFMETVPYSTSNDERLLDLGCGDGRYLVPSVKEKGYVGIGLDPNTEVALKLTKKRFEKQDDKFFLIKGVAELIPLKSSTVAVVLCNSTMDHTLEPLLVLKEIHRTLKKNGILILWQGIYCKQTAEHETHLRVFTKNSLKDMLTESGFLITLSKFLGFAYFFSSNTNGSVLSKIPKFLTHFLVIFFKIYLAIGKIIPKYASIAIFKLKKIEKIDINKELADKDSDYTKKDTKVIKP